MLTFEVITIFPEIFEGFLKESIIKRAEDKKIIRVNIHNLRKWAKDKHKTVDDKPFGGGRGMVLKVEPIYKAVSAILSKRKTKNEKRKTRIILFTPRGKKFNQKLAYQLSKLDQIIMICGRYEGVDERVAKHIADLELSVGDYVLMGGEVPAMAVVEAVSRLVPGVLGKSELLPERFTKERGRSGKGFIEYPQYTRPEIFEPAKIDPKSSFLKKIKQKKWIAPKVLLSGDHKKIEAWRKNHSKVIN